MARQCRAFRLWLSAYSVSAHLDEIGLRRASHVGMSFHYVMLHIILPKFYRRGFHLNKKAYAWKCELAGSKVGARLINAVRLYFCFFKLSLRILT